MSIVTTFATGEFTIKRTTRGTYVKGNYVRGPQETVTLIGSMQPASARELKLPEEGDRIKQYYKFFTDEPVLVDSERTLGRSDEICINGEVFRAMSTEQWQNMSPGFQGILTLRHFMTIVWREPQQASDGQGSGL